MGVASPVAEPGGAPAAWYAGVLFAVSHACAKAAIFLAAGTVRAAAGHDAPGGARIDRTAARNGRSE